MKSGAAVTTKYPGKCSVCGASIPAGEDVSWNRETRTISHPTCADKVPVKDEAAYEPIPILPGSDEQEAIYEHFSEGRSHMVINAGPGVGKTFSMCQCCLRADKDLDILFVAFNKHIAAEANGKLRASGCGNVRASTYHSLGYRILRDNFKSLGGPDEKKMQNIFERLCPPPQYSALGDWRRKLNLAEKLAGFCKNYLIDHQAANFRQEIERIADHHGLDMNGGFQDAVALVPAALEECKMMAEQSIDFDDMIWLPVVLKLQPSRTPNRIISDEAQDLNAAQHELMFLSCPTGRAIVVGDKRQAIYQFRGAMAASMDVLRDRLAATKRGVREFPLTITRRCPKRHVALARNLFPQIQAMPDAPEGEVHEWAYDKAVGVMRVGDMVVCRTNAPLIKCAYALIKLGVRPAVKGRDIGKGLLSLVDKLDKMPVLYPQPNDLMRIADQLRAHVREEMDKLLPLGDRGAGRVAALREKADCLMEFLLHSKSILEMRTRIESMFVEDANFKNAVVLGTVHRTKGLESPRVFVLAPELIPHPMAKQEWEREGEKNIAWIAATRAKYAKDEPGTLVFVGAIPEIYKPKEKKDDEPKREDADLHPGATAEEVRPEEPDVRAPDPVAPDAGDDGRRAAQRGARPRPAVRRGADHQGGHREPAELPHRDVVVADDEPPF